MTECTHPPDKLSKVPGQWHKFHCACGDTLTSRQLGISPRQLRTNPRATGRDQREKGANPRAVESDQQRRLRRRKRAKGVT